MAGTPIDLSAYKVIAGEALAAAKISNSMTAIETYTTASIDPASMLQKAATIGQTLVWDGTKWAPGAPSYPIAPTMIGPTCGHATAAGLTANTAYLMPIPGIVAPTTVTRLCFYVSTGSGTGNVDIGIYYSDDEATFTRLVSKGSTVTPGAAQNALTVGATVITPVAGRRWYLAFGCSSATPTFGSASGGVFGSVTKATSFPLPASLTGTSTSGLVPLAMHALV